MQLRVFTWILVSALVSFPFCCGFAQPNQRGAIDTREPAVSGNPEAEIDAIRAGVAGFVEAFNKHDAKAIAAFWTKEGEYVDESGNEHIGHDAIEACYRATLTELPNAKLQVLVNSIKLIGKNVAIEDGQALLEQVPAAFGGESTYTAVHVKVDGKWLMASVRETATDTNGAANDLNDLEFLIGDWTAEESGVRTDFTCRWIGVHKFVERRYTTTQLDGTSTTGVQVLGLNPQSKQMQAWNFSADGGHTIGVLSAVEGGWVSIISGSTGEGVATTAINTFKRLDDNAYVWQSTKRTLGGQSLSDGEEVVVRRKRVTR